MRLDLVVGPNGAGKTTIAELVLSRTTLASPFVNAGVIAEQRWPGDTERHAYEAADIAGRTRAALIEARLPFIAETVFSHESKLDLIRSAKAAGYTVALQVVMVPVEVSVARVRRRVDAGGHRVPEEKIRERHERLWPLVRIAISLSDSASVWDNTAPGPATAPRGALRPRRRCRRAQLADVDTERADRLNGLKNANCVPALSIDMSLRLRGRRLRDRRLPRPDPRLAAGARYPEAMRQLIDR